MPAYFLARVIPACGHPGCSKPSAGKVHNTVNAPIGDFCEKHGKALVAQINAARDMPVRER